MFAVQSSLSILHLLYKAVLHFQLLVCSLVGVQWHFQHMQAFDHFNSLQIFYLGHDRKIVIDKGYT